MIYLQLTVSAIISVTVYFAGKFFRVHKNHEDNPGFLIIQASSLCSSHHVQLTEGHYFVVLCKSTEKKENIISLPSHLGAPARDLVLLLFFYKIKWFLLHRSCNLSKKQELRKLLPGALVPHSTIRNNLCNQFQFKISKFRHLHEGTTTELSVWASIKARDASCNPHGLQHCRW